MRAMLTAGLVWLAILTTGCGQEEGISSGMITTLESGDFREKFNADGTVECAEPHYVYSALTLPVKDVLVKEWDHVQAGDLLCVLDTESIEKEIRASLRIARQRQNPVTPFIVEKAQIDDDEVIKSHIAMFVNDFSENVGEAGWRALENLWRLSHC